MAEARATVIGVGNPDRGDDAVGRAVAGRLSAMGLPGVDVIHMDGEIAALIEKMADAPAVYLIDACVSGARPGDIRRFDMAVDMLPPEAPGASTHGLGLAQAVELARSLGQLPLRCIVYAVEAAQFEHGAPLTPSVERACGRLAGMLRDEIIQSMAGKAIQDA